MKLQPENTKFFILELLNFGGETTPIISEVRITDDELDRITDDGNLRITDGD